MPDGAQPASSLPQFGGTPGSHIGRLPVGGHQRFSSVFGIEVEAQGARIPVVGKL
ncbi:hypothetical protein L284_21270 [Novosphingobium lindaniclasticum LE124]|uniref:Uncharacterized protein n=1 Tax=Novosphingobium lindaniclasticum LE124 TaxID=1096930 RepID=T0IFK9_9SPHN|nr:hypothetical protein L284_21270 [Novosphingobium lindaniclasticum LE124]